MQNDLRRYRVHSNTAEVPGVATISLTEEDGTVPQFIAGQYINVYFPETHTPEGKAYSISSAPHEPTFSITVRAIGEFSNRLCALKPNDIISASLPYGFFYPEKEESSLVMLAAGIGVAPFRSMLREAAQNSRHMSLFHSIRSSSDALFQTEFEDLKKKMPNFSLSYFVTREEAPALPAAHQGRMQAKDILTHIGEKENTEFLICGSIPFTRDMWRALRHEGVSEDKVYTEAFFSH